jgi:ABC-type bacteriocin/lantibiotic exporter with double-glycine peptidase domain
MPSKIAGTGGADAEGLFVPLRRLYAHLSHRRRLQLLLVVCLTLAGAAAELATIGAVLPFLVLVANPEAAARLPIVGRIFGTPDGSAFDRLMLAALIFAGVAIAAAAVRLLLTWASQKFVYRLGHDIGCEVYERTLHEPYANHIARNSSTVIANINRVQPVIAGLLMPLIQGVAASVMAAFIVAGLIAIDPLTAAGAAAGFGVMYLAVSLAARRRLKANSRLIASMQGERIKTIQEGLGGIRDVILDGTQQVYLAKFARLESALRDAQATSAFIGTAPRYVIEAAGMILVGLLAVVLASRSRNLAEVFPVLGAFALGAQRLLPLLQQIYTGWAQISVNRHNLLDLLKALGPAAPRPGAPGRPNATPLPFEKSISFDTVSFRYAEGEPMVLSDVSFVIPKGARVGVVGQSGRGKSTLLDLVMGLLLPVSGVIRIDGEPLTAATMRRWQSRIAHVPQSIYLADASIAGNIALGVAPDSIDIERVREAAQLAAISDFVESLPAGYATEVGERGARLSGGQRQRIGIARALYRKADVLVFDEATNALDSETEKLLIQTISDLKPRRTIFVIAHRWPGDSIDLVLSLDAGGEVRNAATLRPAPPLDD